MRGFERENAIRTEACDVMFLLAVTQGDLELLARAEEGYRRLEAWQFWVKQLHQLNERED